MSKFEDPILLNNPGTIGTVNTPTLITTTDTGVSVDGNLSVVGSLTITGAQYDTDWHYVGAVGEPAFQNGWVNYNTATYPSARFRKLTSGCIIMEGLVKNGTVASTIFTLPVGYRPAGGILHLPLASPNSQDVAAFINVLPSGDVRTGASSMNDWVSLNSAPFYESGGYPVKGATGDPGADGPQGPAGELILGDITGDLHVTGDLTLDGVINGLSSTLLSYQKDSTTRTFTTAYSDGWITSAFTVPKGTVFKVDFSLPCRNDYGTWGGGYLELYYELNLDSNWISLGNSGYDMAVMHLGAGDIATYNNEFVQDFSARTQNTQVRYKFSMKAYEGTLSVNGSHDITDGAQGAGNGIFWSHIVAYSLTGITGPQGVPGSMTLGSVNGDLAVGNNLTVTGTVQATRVFNAVWN